MLIKLMVHISFRDRLCRRCQSSSGMTVFTLWSSDSRRWGVTYTASCTDMLLWGEVLDGGGTIAWIIFIMDMLLLKSTMFVSGSGSPEMRQLGSNMTTTGSFYSTSYPSHAMKAH